MKSRNMKFLGLRIILLFYVIIPTPSLAGMTKPPQFPPSIIGGEIVQGIDDPIALSTVRIKGYRVRSSFTCSGVLIEQDTVLTAAHCLAFDWTKTEVFLSNGLGPFKGVKITRHENYSEMVKYGESRFDIAMIKLSTPVPAPFRPAQLIGADFRKREHDQVVLAGYGQSVPESNPRGPNGVGILRKVSQEIINPQFNNFEFLVNIQKKGSCFGDSGGPAFINLNGSLYLLGLTSRLTDNDIVPAPHHKQSYACINDMIYSDVSAYRGWILENVL
jgi:hypothetical protein